MPRVWLRSMLLQPNEGVKTAAVGPAIRGRYSDWTADQTVTLINGALKLTGQAVRCSVRPLRVGACSGRKSTDSTGNRRCRACFHGVADWDADIDRKVTGRSHRDLIHYSVRAGANMKAKWMNHSGFVVSDMERSLAFYRDLLGLQEERTQYWRANSSPRCWATTA